MAENQSCPICGETLTGITTNNDLKQFICPFCGEFIIKGDGFLGPKECASIYYFLTQVKTYGETPTIVRENEYSDINRYVVTMDEILNLYPKDIDDRINKVLQNIAKLIPHIGQTFCLDVLNIRKLSPVFFVDINYSNSNTSNQIQEILEILCVNGLLKSKKDSVKYYYTLSLEGWRKVQELQRNETGQVFIAMWFDPKMDKAKKSIIRSITDSGYIHKIISDKEYTGLIVPEILSEIERSRFVIADFTENRGGVYYEAGYAEGLKKTVIYTCNKKFFEVHFDIRQENFILWDTPEDLYKRLYKRIDAVVGLNK